MSAHRVFLPREPGNPSALAIFQLLHLECGALLGGWRALVVYRRPAHRRQGARRPIRFNQALSLE